MTSKREQFLNGTYVSLHQRINKPDGFDLEEFDKVQDEMKAEGFKKIEIDELKVNNVFRYTRLDHSTGNLKFVGGGLVKKIDKTKGTISYLAGRINGVFIDDLIDIWARISIKVEKSKKKGVSIIAFRPIPDGPKKYEVTINSKTVFKSDSLFNYERFLTTTKYKRAVETGIFLVETS